MERDGVLMTSLDPLDIATPETSLQMPQTLEPINPVFSVSFPFYFMLTYSFICVASFMSKLLSDSKCMELAKISCSAASQLCDLGPVS